MGYTTAALEKKLALLERLAELAQEQANLAGDLTDPEKSDRFNLLFDERQRCIEQIDAIEQDLGSTVIAEREMINKIQSVLLRTRDIDRKTSRTISNGIAALKNQLGDLSHRKKSMFVYNTNIMTRKSMVVDSAR